MTTQIPRFDTIIEVLRWRAQHQPSKLAYTFLVDGKIDEPVSWTYEEVDRYAQIIGAFLDKKGLKGERAILFYHPGLDFLSAFLGCLYAGVVAIPAPPPDPRLKQSLPRLQSIVIDSQASVVLTNSKILAQMPEAYDQIPEFQSMQSLATDTEVEDLTAGWRPATFSANDLAYLQYTSGSTSTPKGVMINHHNLMHHSACVQDAWGYSTSSKSSTWLPYFHDYGLVDGLMQPLFTGFPAYLLAPMTFVKHPFRWLQAISHYGITHTQAPNFAFDYCVRKISAEEKETLDLSALRSAADGSEPVREDTMTRFINGFASTGFRPEAFCPAYGLAEATLVVSSKKPLTVPKTLTVDAQALENKRVIPVNKEVAAERRTRDLVSCGPPVSNMHIAIANLNTHAECQSDEVGEIWVSDPSVADGYWQRPDATHETFQAYLSDTGAGPFLRTGDLGFMHEGELYITGRLKDMIIIRGQNYYPQDIEAVVEKSHAIFKPNLGAAFSVERGGEEQLVIAHEINRRQQRSTDLAEVIELVKQEIWEYFGLKIEAILLLKSGTIPRTSSGKIQRQACRAMYLAGELTIVDSWQMIPEVTTAKNRFPTLHNSLYNGSQPRLKAVEKAPQNQQSAAHEAESRQKADALIAWLRPYANSRVNSRIMDERRTLLPHVLLDFGNRGILGLQVPAEYGGLELNNRDALRVFQQLGGIDLTLATFIIVNDILGTRPIIKYGTTAVKQELLPIIASGRELASFAYTEPVAGSNPRGIAATAVPDGQGGWLINGQKSWIGAAAWAGVINVFAQQYDENNNPIGISGFVVRQGAAGLSHGPEALTTGMRALIQNSVIFNDVHVAPENLLGQAGHGMETTALDAMMYTRLVMAAVGVGGMKHALQLMHRYATRRHIATGRLLDNPVSLMRFSELTAATAAVEALVTSTAELLDRGLDVPEEAFVACKTSGPEYLWETSNALTQMLGGRGYIETNIAPQLMRDARIFRIFEGPTETLNMYLGSRVVHKFENIEQLVGEFLHAPTMVNRLREAADQIMHHCLRDNAEFADQAVASRWAHSLIGELATHALLAASAHYQNKQNPDAQMQRAAHWAEDRFEKQLKEALHGSSAAAVLQSSQTISDIISGYEAKIGDLEQTFAGEDHDLDPVLRRAGSAAPQQSSPTPAPAVKPAPKQAEPAVATADPEANLEEQQGKIRTWLDEWLARRLHFSPTALVNGKSFADYGLDSVMAVELAMDLEKWLTYPLEATIVWNFPTPDALAAHLAHELFGGNVVQDRPADPEREDEQTQLSSDELDQLSDAEMAALLAAELEANNPDAN